MMSHQITTQVTHRFDLTEQEIFDHKGYRKTALRVDMIVAVIRDGSLSSVSLLGAPVLKSGALGKVRSEFWGMKSDERVQAILRAHGVIKDDEAVSGCG
jgi:hypothetical protein